MRDREKDSRVQNGSDALQKAEFKMGPQNSKLAEFKMGQQNSNRQMVKRITKRQRVQNRSEALKKKEQRIQNGSNAVHVKHHVYLLRDSSALNKFNLTNLHARSELSFHWCSSSFP